MEEAQHTSSLTLVFNAAVRKECHGFGGGTMLAFAYIDAMIRGGLRQGVIEEEIKNAKGAVANNPGFYKKSR